NAVRRVLTLRDDKGEKLWTIYKERPDSPMKIDAAMAGALSWEARRDAIAAGATGSRSVYEERGIAVW
ncbi:MAG TPA: terminase, partial [Coriobacteriia bacterium]|nr:terminase [Coriobacteriia bacterium]